METVLVTGGTGFIGLHCLQQLLDKGYKVRTTLRSESRKQEVMEAMKKHSSNCENLEFFIADLLSDDGWSEAVDWVESMFCMLPLPSFLANQRMKTYS